MKTVLVVGLGEVGRAIAELVGSQKEKFKIYRKDFEPLLVNEKIDVMHICLPFTEKFVDDVVKYINLYRPALTIINSTVRPKTTQKIFNITKAPIVHSPVRGSHPQLKEGILRFVKFIGPVDIEAGKIAKQHFEELGVKAEIMSSPVETEVGKLLCTSYYGVNIAFHQEMDRICDCYGADFKQAVTLFNETCTMDKDHKVPRPIMYPGFIGGHCVIPNIYLLKTDIKSDFLDTILHSNELTRKKLGIKNKE